MWKIAVFALALTLIGVEVFFRIGPPSEEAQAQVVRMAIASTCPDLPEARTVAIKSAMAFSLRNPASLPPWHVASLHYRATQESEVNIFATGFCQAVIDGTF